MPHTYTVEPLNNGHIGTDHLERLSSFRGNNVLPPYRLVYTEVSFIQSVLYQRFYCIPEYSAHQ